VVEDRVADRASVPAAVLTRAPRERALELEAPIVDDNATNGAAAAAAEGHPKPVRLTLLSHGAG